MPTKKESHAKRASISLTPRFSCRVVASRRLNRADSLTRPKCKTNPIYHPNKQKIRNEPNPRTPSIPPPPISAKRTQSQPWRTCGGPQKTKRTQFTHPHGHPPNGWQPFAQQRDGSPNPQIHKTSPIPVPLASRWLSHTPFI